MPKLSRLIEGVQTRVENLFQAPLDADPLPPMPPPDRARAVIATFYMANIYLPVVAAQRRVLKRFTPPDVAIDQVLTDVSHGESLTRYMRSTPYDVVIFLDIDCVPTREGAVDALIARAAAGRLAGAAQSTAGIDQGRHMFVAPCCMALSRATYGALGSPSFAPTARGDVAEELTHLAEEKGVPFELSFPIDSADHKWKLGNGLRYGVRTTYDNGFFHAFEIRRRRQHRQFIADCDGFIAAAVDASQVG